MMNKIKKVLILLCIIFYMNPSEITPKIHYEDGDVDYITQISDSIIIQYEDDNTLLVETAKFVSEFIIYFKNEKAKEQFIKINTYNLSDDTNTILDIGNNQKIVIHNYYSNLNIIGFYRAFKNFILPDNDKLCFKTDKAELTAKQIIDVIFSGYTDQGIKAIEFIYERRMIFN